MDDLPPKISSPIRNFPPYKSYFPLYFFPIATINIKKWPPLDFIPRQILLNNLRCFPLSLNVNLGNVAYSCDQCEYKATQKWSLKSHIESILDNVAYSCDQCEYKATQKPKLKSHIESIHGNVTYSCDNCEYKATQKLSLKSHIESIHGNVANSCEQCEYKATTK